MEGGIRIRVFGEHVWQTNRERKTIYGRILGLDVQAHVEAFAAGYELAVGELMAGIVDALIGEADRTVAGRRQPCLCECMRWTEHRESNDQQ